MTHAAVLDAFAVLRTDDLCEARAAVAMRYCDHKLTLQRGRQLNMRYNHVRGENVSLNVLGYGGDVHINPGELQDFYLLQIPLQGSARICHRGQEFETGAQSASILNPDRPTKMEWRSDCTQLMLQVDAAFLNALAEQDAGGALPGPVRFAPNVDLATPDGRALKSLVLAKAKACETGSLDLNQSNLRALGSEHEIARALLALQPSNVSQCLQRPSGALLPRTLRRAVRYIHENYHHSLRLDDIAMACALHPRTLQAGFKSAMGLTPTAYLKKVRLDAARYMLLAKRDLESVTDVAYSCGFTHLGRFSRDYRTRFGESPSKTIGSA